MPNVNRPSGLTPVKYLGGADWDGKVNQYYIAAANTNPFYVGDLVDLVTGGGDPTRGIQGITLATAGNPAIGVIVAVGTSPEGGPYVNMGDLSKTFRPTGAQPVPYYAAVCDDPYVIFEAQESTGVITAAQTSFNANIVYAAPPANVVVSGTMINSATVAVTATFNLKLMGLQRRYEAGTMNTFGLYAKWLCLINSHRYKSVGTLGI